MKLAARKITTLLAIAVVGNTIAVEPLHAQIAPPIVPNPGDTNTIVTPVGKSFLTLVVVRFRQITRTYSIACLSLVSPKTRLPTFYPIPRRAIF